MNYIQACLEFAAQLGQIADDTLEAVERRRILENEKRKELLEKGITVYGLSNFSVPAYILWADKIPTGFCRRESFDQKKL